MTDMGYLVGVLLWILIAGLIGRAIAKKKGRGRAGFWLGALLGWIGWIIAAFLKRAPQFGTVHSGEMSQEDMLRMGAMLQSRQSPTPAPVVGGFPAAWHPDPTGRFEFRYWDGARWTASVSRGGHQSLNPC